MKRKLHIKFVLVALIGLMFSCATSNDVTNNRRIQKRKYNKGFFVDFGKNSGASSKKNDDQIALEETPQNPIEEESTDAKATQEKSTALTENSEETLTTNQDAKAQNENERNPSPVFVEKEKVTTLETSPVKKHRLVSSVNRTIKKIKRTKENVKRSISSADGDDDLLLILLIILAIILAPLAVGIYEGITDRFWITLILWLLAWLLGGSFLGFGIGGLLSLIAVIYAILIVTGTI